MMAKEDPSELMFECRTAGEAEKYGFAVGSYLGNQDGRKEHVALVCRFYIGDQQYGSVFLNRQDVEQLRDYIDEALAGPLGKLVIAAEKDRK